MDYKSKHLKHTAERMLSGVGIKKTKAAIDILSTLLSTGDPLSVVQLQEACQSCCDLTTFYRILSKFESANLVGSNIFNENAKLYFVKTSGPEKIFFQCSGCYKIQLLEDKSLSNDVLTLLRNRGFSRLKLRVELTGFCRDCSEALASTQ